MSGVDKYLSSGGSTYSGIHKINFTWEMLMVGMHGIRSGVCLKKKGITVEKKEIMGNKS